MLQGASASDDGRGGSPSSGEDAGRRPRFPGGLRGMTGAAGPLLGRRPAGEDSTSEGDGLHEGPEWPAGALRGRAVKRGASAERGRSQIPCSLSPSLAGCFCRCHSSTPSRTYG
ncbi:unnamed protein product [Prorocentrum cordatum]|uniref:Uncharacterized protein n=1 Tax=Prorocentrum cordatum TaxID=2364126 RepID=A0ABN9S5N3_9DINO|nr:unnamed protein product [Polarella glacialis]